MLCSLEFAGDVDAVSLVREAEELWGAVLKYYLDEKTEDFWKNCIIECLIH